MMQESQAKQLQQKTLELNEALVLGSVRQHELTEAAERLNVQLNVEVLARKRIEDELRQAHEQLAERAGVLELAVTERTAELTSTNKQLEALVYTIAHDLRAPLRSMQGFSAMLLEDPATVLSAASREFAKRFNKSAQFLDALLKDLVAFSRVAQQQIELSSVNLELIVRSMLTGLEKEIYDKKGRVEIAGPWPAAIAHEGTLRQVLFNLVSNALKFVAVDIPPFVRLRAEDRGEFIRVWVEDNGAGIAPDHQTQVFRLFTRLSGDRYAGTGVGLAIVQKGIERMGGRVGVESAPGRGSQFWFELRSFH